MLKIKEPYNQLSYSDEQALESLCAKITNEGAKFIEIGCWLGNSTSIIAKRAKELNGSVICIDTFEGSKDTFLQEYARDNNVYNIFRDNMNHLGLGKYISTFAMKSDEAHKFLKDNEFDFIFVDGDHIYEQVKNDIHNYYPKMKSGAIFSGHDYEIGFDLDMSSLNEIDLGKDMSRGFHCGVVKAVRDKFTNYSLAGDRIWWLYV